MNIGEWTAVVGLVISVLAAVYASTKVIVRSVMAELHLTADSQSRIRSTESITGSIGSTRFYLSTRRDTPRSLTR
jgi:NADP-dependent 3-hydroxy acid dehydrogenase YdfG